MYECASAGGFSVSLSERIYLGILPLYSSSHPTRLPSFDVISRRQAPLTPPLTHSRTHTHTLPVADAPHQTDASWTDEWLVVDVCVRLFRWVDGAYGGMH